MVRKELFLTMSTQGKKKKRRPKGTGAIYYVERRKSYVGNTLVDIGKGKTKKKYVYGKTKTEVADKLRDIEYRSKNGEYIEKDEKEIITFYDLADKMLEDRFALNEIRSSTYDRHLSTLKMLADISGYTLNEITERTIKEFFKAKLYYSQSSINKMYQLLGAVFKHALKQGVISDNPIEDIKRPKSEQEQIPVRALTVDEQNHLVDVLLSEDVQYSEIMLISLYSGMRIGEICALSVEDVNFAKSTVFIHRTVSRGTYGKTVISNLPKDKETRTVPIDEDIVQLLKECIGDRKNGLIFLSSNNHIITTNQVNSVYSNVLKQHGIIDNGVYGKVDLHSLRHTYASRCLEYSMPIKVLQDILGHSDASITLNTYCSVFEKYKNEHLAIVQEYMKQNNLSISCHIGCHDKKTA